MGTKPPSSVIAAAKACMHDFGIPASVQIAQFALESAWGQKVTGAFNYWGMKALPGQASEMVMTHEVYKGTSVKVPQPFRSFSNDTESFRAHAKLLATGSAYADFRSALPNVALAVYQLGGGTPGRPRYATAPAKEYGYSLMAVIRGSDLLQYDGR